MISILVFFIIVLYFLRSWLYLLRDCRRINVKGPLPLPLLGNAHMFLVKTSEFLNLLEKFTVEYGDSYRVHFLSTPYVMLSHPKYIEPLLSSTEIISKGKSYDFLRPWLGNGLLTSSGQRWKTHRKFLTPAFHFSILHNFVPVFCKHQNILTEKLRCLADGRSIDLCPIVALATLDIVMESIMGLSLNVQRNAKSKYVKCIEDLSKIVSSRMQIPILGADAIFNLLPLKKRQDTALQYVHEHTNNVIEARREELRKLNKINIDAINDVGVKNKHAFLDLLLLGEVDGKRVDAEKVREEVDTFMFEGHDTTTSGIVYTLYCLAKHRDVQERIFEEQKQILGDDMRDPTYSDLKQMKYLEMAIRESMRLYPPVPMIERRITKDCEVGSMKLIKGTTVVVNIFQSQRHPEVFEDPLQFRPERFESSMKYPFGLLVFSAGPRNCIGQKFAMMELKMIISAMIRSFILLPAKEEPEVAAEVVLRSKTGVYIKLLPRK